MKRKKRNYWNYDTCKREALKYTSRSEFKLNSPSAYVSARKNKILDKICTHMIKYGSRYKRSIYSYEFPDNHVYIGLTYNINRRDVYRKINKNHSVTKHINKTNLIPKLIQLSEYIDINDAINLEEHFVKKYEENGWNILNVAKTGSVGFCRLYWDKEKCKEEALKYNTRNEFRVKSGGAYNSARKQGWLNEICSHMLKHKRKIRLTKKVCELEALKYNTKKEFKEKSNSIYSCAVKNGWISEICSHMIKLPFNKVYWTKDKCEEAAKKCESRTEFSKKYGGAYFNARKNDWLKEFFK